MTAYADVAVIGGGIAGLTLAIQLIQQSVPVQVFEQESELREVGAGVALGGNATRLLLDLGVDVDRVANVPPDLEIRRWSDGDLRWSHPIGDWYGQEVGAPFLTLHRGTLRRLLADAVPPDRIHRERRLIGIQEHGRGVRLEFEHGKDVIAGVVAGADGLRSAVRRYVCGDVAPCASGELGFRGLIRTRAVARFPNPTSLHIWCGPGTHAIVYGLDRGESINVLAVYRPERLPAWAAGSSHVDSTRDEALRTFQAYGWDQRVLELIDGLEGQVSLWALADLPRLARWRRGRVVLLGDAAHAPLPHQGQGAGQAIEDAYRLGRMLGQAGAGREDVLEAFERRRRLRTRLVQGYSRAAGRAVKLTGEAAARRDRRWPELPRRVGWIHAHREEALDADGIVVGGQR